MVVRIKICGITRQQDAHAAVAAGAHGLGFVFYPGSARFIEPETARGIADSLPPFVTLVGVFVDAEPGFVTDVARRIPLDLVQLHGDESPEYARRLSLPYIRTVRMREEGDIGLQVRRYPGAKAILVDSYVPDTPGGTGQSFNWSRLPKTLSKPLLLAGGLNAQNVAAAIIQVRPYAVDVSSGVEQSPGIKDNAKITSFIDAVCSAV